MKILHTYEDGTTKVLYNDGSISLMPPSTDIEIKILVRQGDKLVSMPVAGGLPTEIESEEDAKWTTLSATTNQMELIYKAMVNAGMAVARFLGNEKTTYNLLGNLAGIRAILWPDKEKEKK